MARRPHPEGDSWGARDEVLCLGSVTQHHGGEPLGQRPLKNNSSLGFFVCVLFLAAPC